MMVDEILSSSVTPIKKSMRFQERKPAKKVDMDNLDKNKLKSYDITLNGRKVQIFYDGKDGVIINGKLYRGKVSESNNGYYISEVIVGPGKKHQYRIEYHDGKIYLEGREVEFDFQPSLPKLKRIKSSKHGTFTILAPLPGVITEINVKVGDSVNIGDTLLTLEAMKMQNDILADYQGKITKIFVKEREQVISNQKLVQISSENDN